MVAYSFQKQFAPPIATGTKAQTIRAPRKRHAKVGEAIQLYQGMRTKHCKKIIADPICIRSHPIRMFIGADNILSIGRPDLETFIVLPSSKRAFAQNDGFETIEDMHQFWKRNHGEGLFIGQLIVWSEGLRVDWTGNKAGGQL